jgi:amino acid transporter
MSLKTFFIGKPIPPEMEKEERLNKFTGLAIFSSDALASVAYGTEEILLALLLGGTALIGYTIPVAICITALVFIVGISYFQVIHAYPSGGGSYTVAKENLGKNLGLVAGVALIIDYVLTVAVEITAGVAAITSAFPSLYGHKILICLGVIILITIINLRGVRESGKIFTAPAYLFIFSVLALIICGIIRSPNNLPRGPLQTGNNSLALIQLFIVLKAFASGCSTLTGIEAVANGVKAFKPPESRNAGITLIWIIGLLVVLFMGTTVLANHFGIIPNQGETVLSQLARGVFGAGFFYYLMQFSTALILILSAITSFAGFPRLTAIMARDNLLPKKLSDLGDRLVYSNGIIVLGILASLLVIAFNGYTHALIPLYLIGVFLAFTLSQAGMVKHWLTRKGKMYGWGVLINGVGALTTLAVTLVMCVTKFRQGAWLVMIAIPVMVYYSKRVQNRYEIIRK